MTVGPHDQVHGSNAEPGRMIWNIETPDVKAEFDRFVAAGARWQSRTPPAARTWKARSARSQTPMATSSS